MTDNSPEVMMYNLMQLDEAIEAEQNAEGERDGNRIPGLPGQSDGGPAPAAPQC
jgi:hypothetical protein